MTFHDTPIVVADLPLADKLAPSTNGQSPDVAAAPRYRTIIKPRRGWQSLELDELWHYRPLLWAFLWRDIKATHKQTVLGISWLFIAPLFSVAVFSLVFGRLAKMPSDGVPYPLFVFAGTLLWNAFGPAIQGVTGSVVSNSHFIQKVYFPRLLIPVSAALSGIVNLAIMICSLLLLMCCFGHMPPWTAIFTLPLAVLVLAAGLGIGMWLAPLNAKYRDIGYLTGFAVQLGFYLTPVVYPISLVPARYQAFVALNPVAGYIGAFRWCLFGGDLPGGLLVASIVATVLLLFSGAFFFARQQGRFADVI